MLGGLKDEIKDGFGEEYTIRDVIAVGAKSYCYTVVHKETGEVKKREVKCKGISLTVGACEKVTPEAYQVW